MNKYKITFKYELGDNYGSDIVYADSFEEAEEKFQSFRNKYTQIVRVERLFKDAMDAEWGDK